MLGSGDQVTNKINILCSHGPHNGWEQEEIGVEIGNRADSKQIIMQISL